MFVTYPSTLCAASILCASSLEIPLWNQGMRVWTVDWVSVSRGSTSLGLTFLLKYAYPSFDA